MEVRMGPYGAYLHMDMPPLQAEESEPVSGEEGVAVKKRGRKKGQQKQPPRRAALPQGVDPRHVTAAEAAVLLDLPRQLGVHPEDGQPVLLNKGRCVRACMHACVIGELCVID
jgi:DNA topoisomerase-1